MNDLRKGDLIQCRDEDDLLETMKNLEKAGVSTDFNYELDGFYLEVVNVES